MSSVPTGRVPGGILAVVVAVLALGSTAACAGPAPPEPPTVGLAGDTPTFLFFYTDP